MNYTKIKALLFAIFAAALLFFGNDFAFIDIEKTAIITALGVDIDESGEYLVTAQIAVPEDAGAGTGNRHVEIEGKGVTVGAAIKQIGDSTGWYPHLSFCNMVILGKKVAEENAIKVLDYFAQTLRIQGSAMAVLAEDKAKDILTAATPLDKTPAFALQKVLFKNPGFDSDIASIAIKTFCMKYYDVTASGYMPLITMKKTAEDGGSSGGGSSGGGSSGGGSSGGESQSGSAGGSESGAGGSGSGESTQKETVFTANTTVLFKNGLPVGALSPFETLVFNALKDNITGTTIELENVSFEGEDCNVLVTVIKNKPKIKVTAGDDGLHAYIDLKLYCKISDKNAETSSTSYSSLSPLPKEVAEAAEKKISEGITSLIQQEKLTDCDFLDILRQVYRHNHREFEKYKENFAAFLTEHVSVTVSGQK